MGMCEARGKDQKPALTGLDAPFLIKKLRLSAFFNSVEIKHRSQLPKRVVARVFKVPHVIALSGPRSLELAVEVRVASLLQDWIAIEVEVESKVAKLGVGLIHWCNQAVVEESRRNAIEQGLFISNLFLALAAWHNQAIDIQVVEDLLAGEDWVICFKAADKVGADR